MPIKSSNLNWAFSSLGCPELSLEEMITVAQQYNIKNIELRTLSNRTDLPKLLKEVYPDLTTLRNLLDRESISIAALGSSAKLVGSSAEAKEELYAFADLATALDVPFIRVFDGGSYQPELSNDYINSAVSFIDEWEKLKAQNAWTVDIIIETHDALCSGDVILELNKHLNSPLLILWDAHHTWKKAGEPIQKTWSQIKDLVRHVHFKDSISVPSARHPFTYVHLGEGEFNLDDLFQLLEADNFPYAVSLEWEKQWHPYLDPISSALSKLQPYQ